MDRQDQDALYEAASAAHAPMIWRLAYGYEADPDRRRDLVQEIHIQLWRSMQVYDGRCALRTWVFRVAHNAGASHLTRKRRSTDRFVELESLEVEPAAVDGVAQAHRSHSASRILELIHRLKPLDRQMILLHLEGEAACFIAEVTGLSASNVATKIHRIKKLLNQQYSEGANHGRR